MIKTKLAKYGVMKSKNGATKLFLSNERPSFRPSSGELLEDVKIEICDNIMILNAQLVCFFCNFDNISYDELKEQDKYILNEEYIEYPKILRFLSPLYTEVWIEEKERFPFSVTANTFEIIEGTQI